MMYSPSVKHTSTHPPAKHAPLLPHPDNFVQRGRGALVGLEHHVAQRARQHFEELGHKLRPLLAAAAGVRVRESGAGRPRRAAHAQPLPRHQRPAGHAPLACTHNSAASPSSPAPGAHCTTLFQPLAPNPAPCTCTFRHTALFSAAPHARRHSGARDTPLSCRVFTAPVLQHVVCQVHKGQALSLVGLSKHVLPHQGDAAGLMLEQAAPHRGGLDHLARKGWGGVGYYAQGVRMCA